MSTKAKSYKATNLPSVDATVLDYIKANPELSRTEIAMGLNIRLSTVCGACNRLTNTGLINTVNFKKDESTNRTVALLEAV